MNMISRVVLFVACTLAFTANIAAEEKAEQKLLTDQDLEMLRANIRLDKANLIKNYMQLSTTEAQAFWPIYDEYSAMYKVKVGDPRMSLIDEYVKNRKTLSDKKAKELVEKSLKLQSESLEILKKYYKKLVNAVGAKRALEWYQINQFFDQLINVAISAQVPSAREK